MTMHIVTEFYKEWFSVCPNVTTEIRIIAIFNSLVKHKLIQIKLVDLSMIFYCTKFHLSKCKSLSFLHKIKYEF
jgi:hypothetical protein